MDTGGEEGRVHIPQEERCDAEERDDSEDHREGPVRSIETSVHTVTLQKRYKEPGRNSWWVSCLNLARDPGFERWVADVGRGSYMILEPFTFSSSWACLFDFRENPICVSKS